MAEDARDIYQAHLDVVSAAVWARSYGTLTRHIDETIDIRTIDTSHAAVPRAQAIGNLMAFRKGMDEIGATAYHRVCLDAAFAGEGRIEGRHRTYVLRGGNYAIDPYDNDMTLVLRDGIWLMGDTRVSRHHLGSASFIDMRQAAPSGPAGPTDTPIPRRDP